MNTIAQWEYEEYSHFSRQLAKTKTVLELKKMLHKEESQAPRLAKSHLMAIQKTTSMQSNSQRRAHSRNSLALNYENRNAIKNALEIYAYYPDKAIAMNRLLFLKYCSFKQKQYLPIKGIFYSFNFSSDCNILVNKNAGGALMISENFISDVEPDLKRFLSDGKFFIYNKKKAKNLKTLL